MPDVPSGTAGDREMGLFRNGEVHLRHFDAGVIETLKAVIFPRPSGYYIPRSVLPDVTPPPGMPGVPVFFANGQDDLEAVVYPSFVVTRDDVTSATSRFHPGASQYRVPAPGAKEIIVRRKGMEIRGWDRYEERPAAVPYDLSYTVSLATHKRGGDVKGALSPSQGNALFHHMIKIYQPFMGVDVLDSLGDRRVYFGTADTPSPMDESSQIGNRSIGWSLSITIEAELDVNDPIVFNGLTDMKTNLTRK